MSNRSMQIQTECIRRVLKKLYPTVHSPLIYRHEYEFLFAVILSAQTTDAQVNRVTPRLFSKYPTLSSIANTEYTLFAYDIASINHYKTKARYIVTSAQMILDTFAGEVPQTIRQLTMLPGVGRKSANVVMSELWGRPEGIAVDTHVIRLSQKYGLTHHKEPAKIEQDLMQIIPHDEWGVFPLRLIRYGREYCPSRCKRCPTCPLWRCVRT